MMHHHFFFVTIEILALLKFSIYLHNSIEKACVSKVAKSLRKKNYKILHTLKTVSDNFLSKLFQN